MSTGPAPTPPPRQPAAHIPIHNIGEAMINAPGGPQPPFPGFPMPPNLRLLRFAPDATHVKFAGGHFTAEQPPPAHIASGAVSLAIQQGTLTAVQPPIVPPPPSTSVALPPAPMPTALTAQQLQARADQSIVNDGISPHANMLMMSDQALHQLGELVAKGKITQGQKISLLHALYNDSTGAYGKDCSTGNLDTKVRELLTDIENRGFRTAMADQTKFGLPGFSGGAKAVEADLRQAFEVADTHRSAFYATMQHECSNPRAHQALLPLVNEMQRRYDHEFKEAKSRVPPSKESLQALYEMEAVDMRRLEAFLQTDQARASGDTAPPLTPDQQAMLAFLSAAETALEPVQPPPGTPPSVPPQMQIKPDAMKQLQEQAITRPLPMVPPGVPSPSPVPAPPATRENPAVFEIFKQENHYSQTLIGVTAPSVVPPSVPPTLPPTGLHPSSSTNPPSLPLAHPPLPVTGSGGGSG